jgi:hypothetical protein
MATSNTVTMQVQDMMSCRGETEHQTMSQRQSEVGSSLLSGSLSVSSWNAKLWHFCCFQMIPAVRWTDLVASKVRLMEKALGIRKENTFKILNWRGKRTLSMECDLWGKKWKVQVKLEYLDVTVLRRGVGEVQVVAGRAPACWQVWRGMQYRRSQCFYNW